MSLAIRRPAPDGVGVQPAVVSLTRAEGSSTVVVLQGELDLATRPLLSKVLSGVIAEEGGDVIIDLTASTFVDAATVRTLAVFHDLLAQRGSSLVLRSPSNSATKVITLFGLEAGIRHVER
jgi:anti-anti-sigma factor